MGSRSLQFDKSAWKISPLGETALVLEPVSDDPKLSVIHKVCCLLERSDLKGLTDVIPTYKSIALLFAEPIYNSNAIGSLIKDILQTTGDHKPSHRTINIPVCYDLGLDWDEVEAHTSLKKEAIIRLHTEKRYTIAMMGFIPGFLYLEGLNQKISCPRKSEPRSKVPQGAVGIGGDQTGIYSIESPGGWQIIGRTPLTFFDPEKTPPVSVNLGDTVKFDPISEKEFNRMEMDTGS